MSSPLKICEGVYIFQSDLWMINSGIIINDLGSLVIDPAYFPEEIQNLAGFIKNKNCKAGYLIFTHSDFDHVVGAQYFNGARIVAGVSYTECDREAQKKELLDTDLTHGVIREEFTFPELDMAVINELSIPLKNGRLHLLAAPGHTSDSIFTLFVDQGIFFSGDTLSDMEFPFVYYDTSSYLKTLDLAKTLTDQYDLKTLVPGHGNVAHSREEIISRIETDIDYLKELQTTTGELYRQGLWEREIMAVMMEFSYAGELIEGSMLKAHLDNVKQVLKELKGEVPGQNK